ncbi:hypothetical protein PG985_001853 [Apiospora marii]|uniref:Cytochrome P450 n=1 Tax=Apiospora marii TaxID=335849 RepID=A0ABR1S1A6_9PEZI
MGFQALLVMPLGFVALCLFTFLKTNLLYQIAIRNKDVEKEPPILPHSIPWLGHVFGFLTPVPGRFFSKVLSWYPKSHGGASMKLAGREVRLIFSTTAVQALLRSKPDVANSDTMIKDMACKGLKIGPADYAKYFECRHLEHELSNKYLLRPKAADALLCQFDRFMKQGLAEESRRLSAPATQMGEAVNLYEWLQGLMFQASATAFFGERLFAEYPNILRDFWDFEPLFLGLLFGVPRWVNSKPHVAQENIIQGLTAWVEANDDDMRGGGGGGKGVAPDPDVPDRDWEPRWGSRFVRARQQFFQRLGLSPRGRASMELGLMFALNSNAVPATGWMLMHILDPRKPDVLPRILQEIQEAVDVAAESGGELDFDLPTLISQPLLQSMFQEVLRFYVDVLVTRGVHQDMRLPTEDSQTTLLIKKGTIAMAPSYVNHYDPTAYRGAPVDEFDAERFLVPAGEATSTATTNHNQNLYSSDNHSEASSDDEKSSSTTNTNRKVSQKPYVFSPGAAGAKMIPFGGGRTMCPGRVFAKREVFSALALVLLNFDIAPLAGPRSYKVPGHVSSYSGSGIIGHGGDIKVHIKRRTTAAAAKS